MPVSQTLDVAHDENTSDFVVACWAQPWGKRGCHAKSELLSEQFRDFAQAASEKAERSIVLKNFFALRALQK